MTTFDQRDKGFENKFAHDEELNFKAMARRNKLLGLWAAEKLGKTGADAEHYAKDMVLTDLEASVIDKLLKDFGRAGLTVHISEIEKKLAELLATARKEIMG